MDSHKRLFLIIIILSFFLFAQVSFAQSDSNMTLQDDSHDELSVGESNDLHESDAKNKTVFMPAMRYTIRMDYQDSIWLFEAVTR